MIWELILPVISVLKARDTVVTASLPLRMEKNPTRSTETITRRIVGTTIILLKETVLEFKDTSTSL
ncbi:MAG: hypothetical protein B1H09_04710 [Gemmatimonadaceae bacterium 4484_173]|nr:MAG: hypothetical protein B1H09_04710 [Gemmatimonadaceae bacterium 4484_173]